jgi:hypothetical protein
VIRDMERSKSIPPSVSAIFAGSGATLAAPARKDASRLRWLLLRNPADLGAGYTNNTTLKVGFYVHKTK